MVRSASTCSVTTMVPISAAIDEPARPETIRAASTGTISRVIASATTGPTKLVVPNCSKPDHVCSANTAPLKSEVTTTIGSERTPTSSICSNHMRT